VSRAVNWFNVERGVLPVTYVETVEVEESQSAAVTEETVGKAIVVSASRRI
jgi:hypothetical protein